MKAPYPTPGLAPVIAMSLGLLIATGASAESVPAPAAAPAPVAAPAKALDKLDRVRAEQVDADKQALAAQQRINQLDDESQKMLAEYRRAVADTESHAAYAAQLSRQIESQNDELSEIQRQ